MSMFLLFQATGRGLKRTVAKPAPPFTLPLSQRNKSSMCKPMMATTGVACKPEMKSQSCQTGNGECNPMSLSVDWLADNITKIMILTGQMASNNDRKLPSGEL